MSDQQQQQHRELPVFRLRRSYRSEPTLNPEIPREDGAISFPLGGVRGESRIGVYGGIQQPHSPSHSASVPFSLSHRRSAPTPLSSLQSTREDRSAGPGPRMWFPRHQSLSPLGPSSSSLMREETPQMTTSFVLIEGLSLHSPHADTSPVSVGIANTGEASPSDVMTSQHDVWEEDTKQEEGRTLSLSSRRTAKNGPKRGGMDAHAIAKRRKNREASAKSLRNKKATMAELKKRRDEMEAEIKRREDLQRTLKEEYETARRELEYEKAQWCELERHFLQQGRKGQEEWEKVLARIERAKTPPKELC